MPKVGQYKTFTFLKQEDVRQVIRPLVHCCAFAFGNFIRQTFPVTVALALEILCKNLALTLLSNRYHNVNSKCTGK